MAHTKVLQKFAHNQITIMKDKQSFVCVFETTMKRYDLLKFLLESRWREHIKDPENPFYVTWGFKLLKISVALKRFPTLSLPSPSGLYGFCYFTAESRSRNDSFSAKLVNAENSGNWFSIPRTCEFSFNFVFFLSLRPENYFVFSAAPQITKQNCLIIYT